MQCTKFVLIKRFLLQQTHTETQRHGENHRHLTGINRVESGLKSLIPFIPIIFVMHFRLQDFLRIFVPLVRAMRTGERQLLTFTLDPCHSVLSVEYQPLSCSSCQKFQFSLAKNQHQSCNLPLESYTLIKTTYCERS
jgi:hypothetical protein